MVPSEGTTVRAAVDAVRRRIARLDARLLVQHVAGIGHAEFLAHPERLLAADELRLFMDLVARRAHGEPLAYLTGEREFFGRSFRVTPEVLVPRPDTERLVLAAREAAAGRDGLRAMLAGGSVPPAPFDGFATLEPARDFRNRHASILLAIEAAAARVK